MTAQDRTDPDETLLERQAVAWFTRMNGRPSATDREDFAIWLASSEAHRRHYHAVASLWSDLGTFAEALDKEQPTPLAEPLERIGAARRARGRSRLGAGLALGLALFLGAGWIWLERPHLLEDWRADQITARGEQRTVALADGSTVQLDADTAIAVDLSGEQRHVRLLRGSAFFTVQPSDRPFVVAAREGEARVLGTSFDVSAREDGTVAVTLASGSLEVGLPLTRQALRLKPGESVAYGTAGLGEIETVDLAETTAWRAGRFIFNDMPLAKVLDRIARYRQGRIVLLSSELGQRRVTGNVTLRDTDAALAALQSSVGFRRTALGKVTLIGP